MKTKNKYPVKVRPQKRNDRNAYLFSHSSIDQISIRSRLAMEKLEEIYQYTLLCVEHAIETTRSIKEIQLPSGSITDAKLIGSQEFKEYAQKVENILEQMAYRLENYIIQNGYEGIGTRGFTQIQTLSKPLLEKETN